MKRVDLAVTREKNRRQNPTVLRFDVSSLDEAVSTLEKNDVYFIEKRLAFDWGTIAVLLDPDGNRIEIGEINDGRVPSSDIRIRFACPL